MSSRGIRAEPTLIEYARFHGLAVDHQKQDYRKLIASEAPIDDADDGALGDFKLHITPNLPEEANFRLDRKATAILSSSIKPPSVPCLRYDLSECRPCERLKLEQPALRTDHNTDMRKVRRWRQPKTIALDVPTLRLSDDLDENLGSPGGVPKFAAGWDNNLKREKLQVPRDVLRTMQDTLRPAYPSDIHEDILVEGPALQKRSGPSPISPPLIPCDFHHESEIHAAESRVQTQDKTQPRQVIHEPEVSKLEWLTGGHISANVPLQGHVPENAKDETALVLDWKSPCKEDISVSPGREAMHAADKDVDACMLGLKEDLWAGKSKVDGAGPKESFVSIPRTESRQKMLNDDLACVRFDGDEQGDQMLNWNLLSGAVTNPVLKETMQALPQLSQWLSEPELTVRSEDLLWQPEALRILSTGDAGDEEELGVGTSLQEERRRESQKVSKRPVLSDLAKTFPERQPQQLPALGVSPNASALGCLAGFMDTRKAYKKPRLDPEPYRTSGSELTKTTTMSDFESKATDQVQVPATPVREPVLDLATLSYPEAPIVSSPLTIFLNTRLLKPYRQLTQALENQPRPPLTIIYRDFDDDGSGLDTAPDVVISPTVAAVISTLQESTQRALPGQGGPSRPPIFKRIARVSLVFEKVFILITLPRTLICPFSSPTISSQISALTSFCSSLSIYGRSMIQLIHIPSIATNTSTNLSRATKSPSLIALDAGSQAKFPLYTLTYFLITKHALDPIAMTPAVTPTSSTAAKSNELSFLHEETIWELFLRKAGLNPFAAQVVLGTLKKLDPASTDLSEDMRPRQLQEQQQYHQKVNEGSSRRGNRALWGLAAFVHMSREERMKKFGQVLGRGAMERVSDILDAKWSGDDAATSS